MNSIKGYKLENKISEVAYSVIYRASKNSTREYFLIKLLKSQKPSQSEAERFKFEYELLKHIEFDGILKANLVESSDGNIALIFEDFNGISLKTYIDNKPVSQEIFFKISIRIAEILSVLHKNSIIHKSLNPNNILIIPESLQLKITGFGSAAFESIKSNENTDTDIFTESLFYISPEQTGRMNRPVDYRTDLYSLGIIFFEMLTGYPPFTSNETMEIIHSHIAKKTIPVHHINKNVSPALSEIVLKLLSKNAEDRYKSSKSLKYDLEHCFNSLNNLDNFIPGKFDLLGNLHISTKLYGREKEFGKLIPIFRNVQQGKKELIIVSGNTGIGKSSFINGIQKKLLKENHYFISISKDKQENISFQDIVFTFRELIKKALIENEEKILFLKERIISIFGQFLPNIKLIIPEIEFIIGKYNDYNVINKTIEPTQIILKLISVFGAEDIPFVIFIDNFNKIDASTEDFLIKLFDNDRNIKFIVIASSNKENLSINQQNLLKELGKINVGIRPIELIPLNEEDIKGFIFDTFSSTTEQTDLLSSFLVTKTEGNPEKIIEMINSMYSEKLIYFDHNYGWKWNIVDIEKFQTNDFNFDSVIEKINKLPSETQNLIRLASCLGIEFQFRDLALISSKSEVETLSELKPAIKSGLIQIQPGINKFRNQIIFDAIYSLILPQNKPNIHYKIGKVLLENVKEDEIENKAFDIVKHFNHAIYFMEQRDKSKLAQLNLIAGRKIKTAGNYELALKYFKVGINFISKNSWKFEYDLTFSLYIEAGECEYKMNSFLEAEEYFSLLLKNCSFDSEKEKVHNFIAGLSNKNITEKKSDNLLIKTTVTENVKNESALGLDYKTVMKAFQTLSAEIYLENLLDKLMKTVIENAGAQRGFLILRNNDNLFIEAEGSVDEKNTKILNSLKLEESNSLSVSIVKYVARTMTDIVLNNAVNEGIFTSDPYIMLNKPKSVLCTPIIKQSHLIGILYLENNLATGAFTENRLEVLKLLSSQAAIFLENARLYNRMRDLNISLEEHKNNLEVMVEERTRQLKETQQKLLDAAHNAGMAEIATGVLHNVGNILNSLNVSGELIAKTLERSELKAFYQANSLLQRHIENLPEFMSSTKGLKLANFYLSLEEMLREEQEILKQEAKSLNEKINITKNVVMTQQAYARIGFLIEKVNLGDIVENALSIQLGSLMKHGIKVVRKFEKVPDISVQKSKLLHVLVNIIKNSKEAMSDNNFDNKILTVEIGIESEKQLFIKISDNGKGIPPENLKKIFNHGFTTKKGGHGFGLHTCANSVTEMGGVLSSLSEGIGKGATFKLAFMLKPED